MAPAPGRHAGAWNSYLAWTHPRVSAGATRTRLRHSVQIPPLRVVRPFDLPRGGALVHLHNVSGGVLGGDRLDNEIRLEEGARVQVTTTGSTRIYRHRTEGPTAQQVTRYYVGPDALLEVLPDSLIPYAGSRYRQVTSYQLAPGACLLAWELVTPGREAHGERFAYDSLELQTTISVPAPSHWPSSGCSSSPPCGPWTRRCGSGATAALPPFMPAGSGSPRARGPSWSSCWANWRQRAVRWGSVFGGPARCPRTASWCAGWASRSASWPRGCRSSGRRRRKFLVGEEGVLPRKVY